MKTRRGKITSFTACCVLVLAFSACSSHTTTTTIVSTSPSPSGETSTASPTTAPSTEPTGLGTATIDPALVARLAAAPWARAIVTVRTDGAVAPTLGGALPDGISAGPYAPVKAAALARAGAGVRVVRDHTALASMVVEFETLAAAKALAADPAVATVTADQTRTVLPQPTAT